MMVRSVKICLEQDLLFRMPACSSLGMLSIAVLSKHWSSTLQNPCPGSCTPHLLSSISGSYSLFTWKEENLAILLSSIRLYILSNNFLESLRPSKMAMAVSEMVSEKKAHCSLMDGGSCSSLNFLFSSSQNLSDILLTFILYTL